MNSETVRVPARDLHRLLLEFRAQVERGNREPGGYLGGWHHGVDYDRAFERLADVVDAYLATGGEGPDPRTRCQHDNPVYVWPATPPPMEWINVEAGSIAGDIGPRLRHLAAADGSTWRWKTLCGFTFADDDIPERPEVPYRRCGVCAREQQLRSVVVADGAGAR
jgi:hypothetical protein